MTVNPPHAPIAKGVPLADELAEPAN